MIDAVFFDKLKIILKIINKTESGNCVIAGNTPLAPPCGIPNPSTVVHLGEEAKKKLFPLFNSKRGAHNGDVWICHVRRKRQNAGGGRFN